MTFTSLSKSWPNTILKTHVHSHLVHIFTSGGSLPIHFHYGSGFDCSKWSKSKPSGHNGRIGCHKRILCLLFAQAALPVLPLLYQPCLWNNKDWPVEFIAVNRVGSPPVRFNIQSTQPGTHGQEFLKKHQHRTRLLPTNTVSYPRNPTSKSPAIN
jgi:hypothetical protein